MKPRQLVLHVLFGLVAIGCAVAIRQVGALSTAAIIVDAGGGRRALVVLVSEESESLRISSNPGMVSESVTELSDSGVGAEWFPGGEYMHPITGQKAPWYRLVLGAKEAGGTITLRRGWDAATVATTVSPGRIEAHGQGLGIQVIGR